MISKEISTLCLAFKQYHKLPWRGDMVLCHEGALVMHGLLKETESLLLEVPLSIFEQYKTESNLRQSQFGDYIVINEQLSLRRAGWPDHFLNGWVNIFYDLKDFSGQSRDTLMEWLVLTLENEECSKELITRNLGLMDKLENDWFLPGGGVDRKWWSDLAERAKNLKERYA